MTWISDIDNREYDLKIEATLNRVAQAFERGRISPEIDVLIKVTRKALKRKGVEITFRDQYKDKDFETAKSLHPDIDFELIRNQLCKKRGAGTWHLWVALEKDGEELSLVGGAVKAHNFTFLNAAGKLTRG